jgi:hypothetical protein
MVKKIRVIKKSWFSFFTYKISTFIVKCIVPALGVWRLANPAVQRTRM